MAEDKKRFKNFLGGSFSKAKGKFVSVLNRLASEPSAPAAKVVAALVRTIVSSKAELNSSDIENFRVIWRKRFPENEVDKLIGLINSASLITVEEAGEVLITLPEVEQIEILGGLLELGEASDVPDYANEYLCKLAKFLSMEEVVFQELQLKARQGADKRRRLLRSGAGIITALVIVGIFILIATLLKSVIFGLILAFLMLPIERYFEKKLRDKKSIVGGFFNFFSGLGGFFHRFGTQLGGRKAVKLTAAERYNKERDGIIRRSVSLAGMVLLFILLGLGIFFFSLSFDYWNSLKVKLNSWAKTSISEVENVQIGADGKVVGETEKPFLHYLNSGVNQLREKISAHPVIKRFLDELSLTLSDPEAQRELIRMAAKQAGGLFSLGAGILSAFFTLLLDILLTAFFFLLFLTKMAEFSYDKKDLDGANYLVRTIFNGNWLPTATEDDLKEAERIIGEVIHKLKVWLRGYLSLMLIDFSVYSTVFYFLNVPYFLLLGAIAGCGILLPFIGPVVSAALTCLVTLAVEGSAASSLQIAGIIGIYLIHNGVTEQFILYPSVIGESLGLTTLETIIVVLLGGIFAGITGMIFAIPAAAIIKYLVPQIYKCRKGS